MCFGKRGKYSGGKNRKYFFWEEKNIGTFNKKKKNSDHKKIPVEKNKKERL